MIATTCSRRRLLALGAGAAAAGAAVAGAAAAGLPPWGFGAPGGGVATPMLLDRGLQNFAALRRHALRHGMAPLAVGDDAGAVAMMLDQIWARNPFAIGGLTTPGSWFVIETIGRRRGLIASVQAGADWRKRAAATLGGEERARFRHWWLAPAP